MDGWRKTEIRDQRSEGHGERVLATDSADFAALVSLADGRAEDGGLVVRGETAGHPFANQNDPAQPFGTVEAIAEREVVVAKRNSERSQ